MSKYSVGEWSVIGPSSGEKRGDDGGDFAILANEKIILEAFYKIGEGEAAPARANAYLAAASPEMFSQLDSLINHMEIHGEINIKKDSAVYNSMKKSRDKAESKDV